MNDLDAMIFYLREAIQFGTSADIYELPREEFTPYVNRCKDYVPAAAIPYIVLVMLLEERASVWYRVKRFVKRLVVK